MNRLLLHISCSLMMFGCGLGISAVRSWISPAQPTPVIQSPCATVAPPVAPRVARTRISGPVPQIRKVDFANMSYSARTIYGLPGTFKLKKGRYEGPELDPCWSPKSDCYEPVFLVAVSYGDVTGDGIDEAMVVLTVSIRGTAIPYYVYVFSIEQEHPKELWAFATGDRAEGGLRRVSAENGNLVVELYGEGARVDGDVYVEAPEGACCPVSITRSQYTWNGQNFQYETSQIITIDDGGGGLMMKIPEQD